MATSMTAAGIHFSPSPRLPPIVPATNPLFTTCNTLPVQDMTIPFPSHAQTLSKRDAGRRVSLPFGLAPLNTSLGPAIQSQSKRKADVIKPALKNAGITQGGRRFPTSLADSARARFVSLPVTVPEIDSERDRLARACGEGLLFTPQHRAAAARESVPQSPLQEVAKRPHFARTTSPPARVPKWPCHLLLNRIKRQLKSIGKDAEEHVVTADIKELDRQDWADRNRREDARTGYAFATPIDDVAQDAFTRVVMHGYAHDLPIALVAPIEQLYRTGIHEGSLFRKPVNTERYLDLLDIYNVPPLYGRGFSLRSESTADVAALLAAWFTNIPGGIIHGLIYEPLFHFCVKPSIVRGEPEELEALEPLQIAIARDILRLLPSHNLSILVYVFAFFTQLPLGPDNLSFGEVAIKFGKGLFGESSDGACQTAVWLLERWDQLSEGLLDPEPVDEYDLATPLEELPSRSEVKIWPVEEVKAARI
ncbi:hypothetical protein FA95DRAFT_1605098 [Auriscalpium vulgare]|uniref:Uncharacterized protein n=1 Tax=Auriscalpium vulgare TaxID=40419 RepID=A0ACB8RXQ0_9AGAM|nr:hypothetical protein FA95DRAFT_1605098 [Auriscalpium vulgare]